jgi:hypothetical protein
LRVEQGEIFGFLGPIPISREIFLWDVSNKHVNLNQMFSRSWK